MNHNYMKLKKNRVRIAQIDRVDQYLLLFELDIS